MWTFKFSIERSDHGTGHEQIYYASEEFVDVMLVFGFSGSFIMVFPRAQHYLLVCTNTFSPRTSSLV